MLSFCKGEIERAIIAIQIKENTINISTSDYINTKNKKSFILKSIVIPITPLVVPCAVIESSIDTSINALYPKTYRILQLYTENHTYLIIHIRLVYMDMIYCVYVYVLVVF